MSRLQNSTASARLLTDVPSFTVSELLNRLAPGPLAAFKNWQLFSEWERALYVVYRAAA
jgi:hypothetical protein